MNANDCRDIIVPLLTPGRLAHSEAVAEAAVALARRYGANEHKALLAGLLHDCMKCAPRDEHIAVCARAGQPLGADELGSPQVCHAFAGAAYLSLECGVNDEEILNAVRWHTTGHPGMTLLEEVVKVADLVSHDRTYPDVAHTRRLAAQDLHAASRYIVEVLITRWEKGRPLHPATLGWYAELCKE